MRAFIAIKLPKEVKAHLGNLQEKLKSARADVKWIAPENMHLTLKFLGEIDNSQLEKIAEILEDTANNKKPFNIRISSIGAFPKLDFPRIIWVGIDKGDKETGEIARELEEKVSLLGIPKEKRAFACHLTIARTRSNLNQSALVKILKDREKDFSGEVPEFAATKITLFKSTLTPKGPIYEELKEANFRIN